HAESVGRRNRRGGVRAGDPPRRGARNRGGGLVARRREAALGGRWGRSASGCERSPGLRALRASATRADRDLRGGRDRRQRRGAVAPSSLRVTLAAPSTGRDRPGGVARRRPRAPARLWTSAHLFVSRRMGTL